MGKEYKRITARQLRGNLREYLNVVSETDESFLVYDGNNMDFLLTSDATGLNRDTLIEVTYSDFRQGINRLLCIIRNRDTAAVIKSRNAEDVYVIPLEPQLVYLNRIKKLERENEQLRKQNERLMKYKKMIDDLNL